MTNLAASFWTHSSLLSVNSKGRDCVSHVLQCFAGIHERTDNSCKQKAEYLRRSFVIFHTERGQWQASFIREKSAHLAEVSVTERKFPNSQKSSGNWACANSRLFFLRPRIRAWERGYGHACPIVVKLVLWPLHQHTLSYLAIKLSNSVLVLTSSKLHYCYISFFHQKHFQWQLKQEIAGINLTVQPSYLYHACS